MLLSRLCSQIQDLRISGTADPEITGLQVDSRMVKPGALFAALPGAKDNGEKYIDDAIARGATAVLCSNATAATKVTQIVHPEPRKALGELAAAFYGHPSRKLKLIGVTGTNGKTTVAYILAHLLRAQGLRVGLMGTIQYDTGERKMEAPLTTPDAITFSRSLAKMVGNNIQWAVVEASSHALEQYRVWPHRFTAAVFTNLTRDHLDYHHDMNSYFQSKKRLFDWLDNTAWAIVNQDDPAGINMIENSQARICRYGMGATADIRGKLLETSLHGCTFSLACEDWECTCKTGLVGRYNAMNCLAALSTLYSLGLDFEQAVKDIRDFPGVPGRLEKIISTDNVTAFIDYAHTDDALRSVLQVLRPLAPARLLVVFGCGGDRDRGKRPLMAQAAEEIADKVFLTSDNPRTEDPQAIINDIMAGFQKPANIHVNPDRAQAVMDAINEARPNDVVLVAGKGHEDYQIIGTRKIHLDDRELVREAMEKRHS